MKHLELNQQDFKTQEFSEELNYNINHDDDIIKTPEGLIFNPYNSLNIKISEDDIKRLLNNYGLPCNVRCLEIYQRAFIHRSYTKRPNYENKQQNIKIVQRPLNCLPLSTKSNERLEFLGDGILECITKLYLYKRFPKENEGFMTEKKIAIVKNESIGKIAYEMGLHKWLILSKHAEEKKIRTNLKKLGCLFEAFIGALYLNFETHNKEANDSNENDLSLEGPGFKMSKKFIINVFERHIDWVELIQNDDNYKNILQVKLQKQFKVTPHYLKINNSLNEISNKIINETFNNTDNEFNNYTTNFINNDIDIDNIIDNDIDNDIVNENIDESTNELLEHGFKMGVFLCLGDFIYNLNINQALKIEDFNSFQEIHDYVKNHSKVLILMGEGTHKIKRKAEQIACANALKLIEKF